MTWVAPTGQFILEKVSLRSVTRQLQNYNHNSGMKLDFAIKATTLSVFPTIRTQLSIRITAKPQKTSPYLQEIVDHQIGSLILKSQISTDNG